MLALAIGGLAVGAWMVVQQVRMAPGTTISAPAAPAPYAPQAHKPGQPSRPKRRPRLGNLNTPQKLALYPWLSAGPFWEVCKNADGWQWRSFASLPEEEQARLHDRMTAWASLSAQQRNQARLNFAVTNRLSPQDKRTQWDAYQALSEEENASWRPGQHEAPGRRTGIASHCVQRLAKVRQPSTRPAILPTPKFPCGIHTGLHCRTGHGRRGASNRGTGHQRARQHGTGRSPADGIRPGGPMEPRRPTRGLPTST